MARKPLPSLPAPPGFAARKSGILAPRSYSQTYEAARPTRHRKWLPTITTDSRAVLGSSVRKVIMSYARNAYANNGFVRGAMLDSANFTVGDKGILPQSLIKDRGLAREYEQRWVNWLNISDVRRNLHFNQILRACCIESDVDGDFGFLLTETGGGDSERPGMAQIQTIRAHRIDDPRDKAGAIESQGGVVEDKNGNTTGFSILEGPSQKQRYVPRESFILVGDPDLSDWSRYPSAIAHGLNDCRDEDEIMGFVFDGIKNRTARAFWRRTPTGEMDEDELSSGAQSDEPDSLTFEELQGGEIPTMGPGEELLELSADFPGGMVLPTLTWNKRDFACGYGTPLEVIWESQTSGPALRFQLRKFQRKVDSRRAHVLIPHLMQRLWGYFISKEIKRKALKFDPDWWRVRWVPTSPAVTVDIGREAQQNREDILLGIRTVAEDAGERGVDWEELRDQSEREASDLITRAKRLAKLHDLTFDVAFSILSRRTPNGNLPAAPQAAQSAAPAAE